MTARSYIGIERENGMVEFIYCHWHGAPQQSGTILQRKYNTESSIDNLISHGDLSVLASTLTKSVVYHRDLGEKWDTTKPTTVSIDTYLSDSYEGFSKHQGECFRYIFTQDHKWYVFDTSLKKYLSLYEYLSFHLEQKQAI